jgi:hypothetical protein
MGFEGRAIESESGSLTLFGRRQPGRDPHLRGNYAFSHRLGEKIREGLLLENRPKADLHLVILPIFPELSELTNDGRSPLPWEAPAWLVRPASVSQSLIHG